MKKGNFWNYFFIAIVLLGGSAFFTALGINVFGLALAIVFVGMPAWFAYLFLRGGRIKRLLMRLSEYRHYRKPPKLKKQTDAKVGTKSRIALPGSLVALLASFVFAWNEASPKILDIQSSSDEGLGILFLLLSYVLIIIAVITHMRPDFSRKLKYEILMTGLYFMSFFYMLVFIALEPRMLVQGVIQQKLHGIRVPLELLHDPELILQTSDMVSRNYLWPPLVMGILAGFLMPLIIRTGRITEKRSPSKLDIFALRAVRSGGVTVIIALCYCLLPWIAMMSGPYGIEAMNKSFFINGCLPLLFIPYFQARFLLLEKFHQAPIVYLRSFHYESSSIAFSRIIAKASRKFGVLTAIVHEKQKGSELQNGVSVVDQALTSTVSDDEWKNWVKLHLEKCSVVIIDRSLQTDSVLWEIETARRFVSNPERIITMVHEETAEDGFIADSNTIVYNTDDKSLEKAKTELTDIFNIIFGYGPLKKKAAAESTKYLHPGLPPESL